MAKDGIHISFLVQQEWVIECFKENTTLIGGQDGLPTRIQWFTRLNKVCKDLGASQLHRNSVPLSLEQDQIEAFLKESIRQSEVWKTMKLVVLGHGRVGKSTLLHQLRDFKASSWSIHLSNQFIIF